MSHHLIEKRTFAGERIAALRRDPCYRSALAVPCARRSGALEEVDVRQRAEALAVVEAVADDEAVGRAEPAVADVEVDEAAARAVEQRADRERGRVAEPQRLQQVVEREPRVDD